MDTNDSPVSGETITVWYRQENKKFIAYRCQVKRASAKQGLLIDHIDVDKNDPEKESYLDPKDAHWLIGDWREYETKDAAQYVKANLRADAISDRLRSADVSLNAEQVARVMRKQEAERESKREKEEDLFYLAEHGSAEEMQALLDNGVDLELTEPAYHRTPLMVAAASNTADVVLTLLNAVEDRKTELRVTSPGGFNALHWAAMSNSGTKGAEVVYALLKSYADASLQTKNGDTALDLAIRFRNHDAAALLAQE